MPGIRINSLQELLMLREIQNKNRPIQTSLQQIANSVSAGILKGQEEAEQIEKDRRDFEEFKKGNVDLDGNILEETSFTPGKGIQRKFTIETDAQKLIKQKTQLEIDALRNELKIPSVFSQNTQEAFDSISDLDTTKAIIPRASGASINRDTGEIVVPEFGKTGRPKGAIDIEAKTKIEEASADVQISKEVRAQQEKAGELAGRGVKRAFVASDTAMSEVLRFNQEQFEKFNIKPGDVFGFLDKLTPKQLNRYKASADGAGREAAATVGMQIIPNARAVKMVNIFAKSAAEVGNTIEGNASNAAASMSNAWGNAISQGAKIEMIDGSEEKLSDIVVDPLTGKKLNEIPFPEYLDALTRITQDFRNRTENNYVMKAYNLNSSLLNPNTVVEIESRNDLSEISSEQLFNMLGGN